MVTGKEEICRVVLRSGRVFRNALIRILGGAIMKIEQYFNQQSIHGVSGLFSVCGNFGRIDHTAKYEQKENGNTTLFTYENGFVRVCSEWTEMEYGVVRRKDTLVNLTDNEIEINTLLSRFALVGNEYETYTQYSAWQHENTGAWSRLNTEISVRAGGIRTCNGGAPILGMHDLYTGKNTVFHLIPNCQWEMTARKYPQQQWEFVVVETGIEGDGLGLTVNAGETIFLPEIFFYQAKNKTDLDAYKMHAVFNRLYPRKETPVIYNSWLYCFEWVDVDELKKQADVASELGFEMFSVDAGWFGTGANWSLSVGDWVENPNRGTMGRLKELSDYVRSKGMRMGLWFEPERAVLESVAYKTHPEYFIADEPQCAFLDFANEKAREYILNTVSAQIEKYNLEFVKFDFNASIPHDPSRQAFYRYMQGHRAFIASLKERFPDLYITNCASGGFRMEMGQATYTDSFWFTDNQGPYEGLTIVKDTLKRLPTACIERWNVQKYLEGFPAYHPDKCVGRMVSCNNATWSYAITISDEYTKAFVTGGPIGFSCDLVALPENYKTLWKGFISQYKKDREFYAKATARVLIDTKPIIALQYADEALSRIEVQLFTKLVYTRDIIVYPVVDENKTYRIDEQILTGKELARNGLFFGDIKYNDAKSVTIYEV